MNLAYNYSDGVVAKYIVVYLDHNPKSNWRDLLRQLMNQYSDFTITTDAARVKIEQRMNEILTELSGTVLGLAKNDHKDAVYREWELIQAQLAEY